MICWPFHGWCWYDFKKNDRKYIYNEDDINNDNNSVIDRYELESAQNEVSALNDVIMSMEERKKIIENEKNYNEKLISESDVNMNDDYSNVGAEHILCIDIIQF